MDQQSTTASPANGASSAHDLFVLTDEQILEIEPEAPTPNTQRNARNDALANNTASVAATLGSPVADGGMASAGGASPAPTTDETHVSPTEHGSRDTDRAAQAGGPVPPEPPPWLAAQMKDPWSGEEAKEFWNGVQQARSEAAAYRAAFASPEDARALKDLYPGGVNEARAAATRARLLEDIDRAYFGAPGGSAEQTSAARADLAQRMLSEDPAAFREMVFAGLRAIEAAEQGSTGSAGASNLPRLAQIFAANRHDTAADVAATLGSPAANVAQLSSGGASPAPTVTHTPFAADAANGNTSSVGAQLYPERSRGNAAPQFSNAPTNDALLSAYSAFEQAANKDLERSVGAAIAHTIEQALPNLKGSNGGEKEGARQGVPLQDRLGAAVRQDVEAALKGDRQLGEQIAQILSARRFDNETRAQVVRLIDDRARQLVPSAARRVIGEWTQATLAAHRGKAARSDAASQPDVEPALTHGNAVSVQARGNLQQGESIPSRRAGTSPAAFSSQAAQTRTGADLHRNASRSDARRLDYRKLSDEQILDL